MAKYDPALSALFQALSDPTRRAMLERLAVGPLSVQDLAGPTGLALPTVMRHLAVLQEVGLIGSAKAGRVRLCHAVPKAMAPLTDWLDAQRQLWESRTDRLDRYLTTLQQEQKNDPTRDP